MFQSRRLDALEKIIERGSQTFVDVGQALAEIRDSKLYKSQFGTFEEYCREKWGWEKAYCNHVIRAAETVKALPDKTATIVATESQARELAKAEPEKRVEVIEKAKAVAEEEERPMTARDIREAIEEKPRVKTADEIIHKPKCPWCGKELP